MESEPVDPPELQKELAYNHRAIFRISAVCSGTGVGRYLYDLFYSGNTEFGSEALAMSLTVALLLVLAGPFFVELTVCEAYNNKNKHPPK